MRLPIRSEEHTSELQSHSHLVCRLLLEKKRKNAVMTRSYATGGGAASVVADAALRASALARSAHHARLSRALPHLSFVFFFYLTRRPQFSPLSPPPPPPR